MAYKTVRRNGRDVLINTKTGKEVGAGQRIANELSWMGKGITDNFTYSDKVDRKTGRRLTPAEVRRAEGKPPAKPAAKTAAKPAAKPAQSDAAFDKKYGTNDPRNNLARRETGKTPAPAPRPAGTQPSRPAARPAASRPATPAAPKKPAAPASPKDRRVSASTANRESGNYGTSRTNNPMIDDAMKARMRQREEAQAGSSGSSKPEDKSKYVASDGRPYKGPAFGNDSKPSSSVASKKPAEKGMTLAERMRKRRQGLA